MTGISKPTTLKLLRDSGCACAACHNERVGGLKPERTECIEVWCFVYCKEENLAAAKAPLAGAGDCWTWTAVDPATKLMIIGTLACGPGLILPNSCSIWPAESST